MVEPEIAQLAKNWLNYPLAQEQHAMLETWLAESNTEKLSLFFSPDHDIEFGTAGVRGVMAPGPGGWNEVVLSRVAAGIGEWLGKDQKIFIGYDARMHSREYALLLSYILNALGSEVHFIDQFSVTPLIAFLTRTRGAKLGLMITSSHNPPEYNGLKVFGSDGTQIVSPVDTEILARIQEVTWEKAVEYVHGFMKKKDFSGFARRVPSNDIIAYIQTALSPTLNPDRAVNFVYTPLHGAAGYFLRTAFTRSGYSGGMPVEKQMQADGHFPGLTAPNPEYRANLETAFSFAEEHEYELVLATDGDGDRVGVALHEENGWRMLSGNEIGAILAWYLLRELGERGFLSGEELLISTVVSTPLAQKIAGHFGVAFRETLTGFKNMAAAAREGEEAGETFLLAFEESNGVAIAPFRDKDGLSALRLFAEIAAHQQEYEKTLQDLENEVYSCCGYHAEMTLEKYFSGSDGISRMESIVSKMRKEKPQELSELPLVEWRDFYTQEKFTDGQQLRDSNLPTQNLLHFVFRDSAQSEIWLALRPSGTEPKLKVYFGIVSEFASSRRDEVKEKAEEKLNSIAEWVKKSIFS